jgi:endonuclease/exonuclease/phosphatase family metal-dependent hydrolase
MLSILTLNINYQVDKHGPWEIRKTLIEEVIARSNPDIIALQAVARPPRSEEEPDQALQLMALMPDYRYVFFQPAEESLDGSAKGSAVMSRLPMSKRDSLALSLRPGLQDTDQRRVLHACFELPVGTFHLFNAHFSWVGEQASDNLDEALPYIETGDEPALLVGDFNIPAGEPLLARLRQAGWTDAWTALHPGEEGLTFEAGSLSIRIDYAWLNPALAPHLDSIEIIANEALDGHARLSDHLGLLVRLAV